MTFGLLVVLFVLVLVALSKNASLTARIEELEANFAKLCDKDLPPQTMKEPQKPTLPATPAPLPTPKNCEVSMKKEPQIPSHKEAPQTEFNIVKLFSWGGGILLLLSFIFGITYLIQNAYITKTALISAAIFAGIIMTTAGMYMKDEKVQTTASTLCGCGIVICFLSVYCGYIFEVFHAGLAFPLMAAVAFASFYISVIRGEQYISFLGLVGAFLTPILLSSGQDRYIFFFSFLAFVNIAAISAALKKNWPGLIITSLVFTFICQLLWCAKDYSYAPAVFCSIFALYNAAAITVAIIFKDKLTHGTPLAFAMFVALNILLGAMCLPSGFDTAAVVQIFAANIFATVLLFLFEYKYKNTWILYPALALWLIFGIVYFSTFVDIGWGKLAFSTAAYATQLNILNYYIGAAVAVFLLFFTFPLCFRKAFADGATTKVTSALSGLLAFILIYANIHGVYLKEAMGLLPLMFAAPYIIALCSLYPTDKEEETHHKDIAIYGSFALLFITLIFPLQFSKQWLTIALALEGMALVWLNTKFGHKVLRGFAIALLSVAFLRLITDPIINPYMASANKIFNSWILTFGVSAAAMFAAAKLWEPKNKTITTLFYVFGAVTLFLLLNIEISNFYTPSGIIYLFGPDNLAAMITFTLGWALYGAVACALAFYNKSKTLAKAGIIIICVAVAKLAIFDLWNLEALYRIFGLLGMAIVLIIISFGFQKFMSRFNSQD